jgi:hypothetical protein
MLKQTNTKGNTMKKYEIYEGMNGSGQQVWIVATVVNGSWMHTETFTNKAEAENWAKWA